MFRVTEQEASILDLEIQAVGVDIFSYENIDNALLIFFEYENSFEKECSRNNSKYFIELELEKTSVYISYIFYANKN